MNGHWQSRQGSGPRAAWGATGVLQARFLGGMPSVVLQTRALAQPRRQDPLLPPRGANRHGAPAAAQPYGGNAFQAPPGFLSGAGARRGQPLPDAVMAKMEALHGANFSDVRIHVGPEAPSIGALAFTVGSDIYFAPGQYQPNTTYGHQLLGHELTHVVQQRAGRVRNPFGNGVAVVQDPILEAEADRMGMRAAAQPLMMAGRR